jgi:peptidoglycan/xylan/chitin deacetylase (PgdA/CDA1 family)
MMKQRLIVALISIFVLGSFYLAHAETSGSIVVNITYTNGDRADFSPISMKIYQDTNASPYREISSITGNPFNILSLPLGHQYKIEVYANDMHAADSYVDLEQSQQNLNVNIPLPGGMRVNVLYNDKLTPVENATVEINSDDNKTWATGTTDAKGQTLRFWLSPTTDQSDYYTINVKVGKTLSYSYSPVLLLPGVSQEIDVVTPWPSIVNGLITVKLYNNQSSVISPLSGAITVDLLDYDGNLVSQSPVDARGEAYFSDLKVGDYIFHVIDQDNSTWPDSNVTIDGTKFNFNIMRNQSNATISESSSTKPIFINCNCVAFMLDNIQDYWLDNVQTGILGAFKQKDASLTLGIIANAFGNDSGLINSIKNNTNSDNNLFDIGINGWNFEDFTLYDESHQALLLNQSKSKISSVLGVNPTIFVPPYERINRDTFSAMQDNEIYYVITASDIVPPGTLSGKIHSIPVTVFAGYYHLQNGTLQYMTNDMMMSQIQNSIQNRGFAVVTINFQDYALENNTLENSTVKVNSPDPSQIEKLESLIDMIRGNGLQIVKVSEIGNQTGAASEVPSWVKLSAQSWSQDNASNSEFLDAIQFMIKQNTIKSTTPSAELKSIPNWLKHDAMWWSSGLISDQQFISIIEYLIEVRAIS